MILYFALSYTPYTEVEWVDKYGITDALVSYYVLNNVVNFNKAKLQKDRKLKFFLDSGAFTAFTKDFRIDVAEYADFIEETAELWQIYATLDVIGDYKATDENTKYLESRGLKPLPVFHYGSPESELKRLVKQYDYIALGGLVPLSMQRKKMQGWLDYCFSIIKTDCKIHGFGVNSLWSWIRYPFYSVDATSWNQGSKYGRVVTLDGLKYRTSTPKLKTDVVKYYHQKNWKDRTAINIATFLEAQKQVNRLWESRGIKWT